MPEPVRPDFRWVAAEGKPFQRRCNFGMIATDLKAIRVNSYYYSPMSCGDRTIELK